MYRVTNKPTLSPRLYLLLLSILIGVLVVSACVPPTGPQPVAAPAGPSGKITLYTSVPQPIADKIQADFQSKFPNITLEVFRAGTSAVVTKIATEKEAGAIQADLVWVAEPSTYEDFKEQGLLLQFTPKGADELLPGMADPEGYYYAGRLINMIIGYNTAVEPKPTSWTDLLKPEYQGKLGFPSPLRSGAAQATVKTLVDQFGWEYFEQFKANGGVQVKNNSTVRDQLSAGELSVGVLLDYMVRGAKAKGSPIDYVWPAEGAVFIPSPIAIFKASSNVEAAQTFVEYIISQEGQQTLVELGSFVPVRGDVEPPAGVPAVSDIKRLPTDWKAVREQRQELKDRWVAIFSE